MSKSGSKKGKVVKPPMSREPVTDDARFSTVHNDPRFALPRKKDSKVTIDKRFRQMLEDDDFSHTAKVDRYGRKIASGAGKEEIKKYYKLEESDSETDSEAEEGKEKKKKKKAVKIVGEDDDDEEEEEEEDEEAKPRYDPARGEGLVDTSDESEDEDEDVVVGGGDLAAEQEEWRTADEIPTGDVYRRIAVVNLDWDNVRAQDLMAALSSFAPVDGKVLAVRVYPSEFGKERMEREETEGPPREIFNAKDDDEEESEEEINETTIIKPDSGEEFDSSKLRKYQLERLRYYYAIVECDKKTTAKHIYNECDGAEYEASANFFDLRFVPDDVEFDDEPRDECTRVPVNYKPNDFVTDALQHSKVKLTWDQEDQTRKNKTKKAFTQKEIEEMDLRDYLASSDSEDEDADALKNKYRSLLSLGGKIGGKEEVDGGVEITFTPSLIDAPKQAPKIDDKETTIEKYARKEKEKLKARKEAYQQKKAALESGVEAGSDAEDSAAEAAQDLGFDDPFFADEAPAADKKKEKKKQDKEAKKKEAIEKAAKRAELELLMVDDEDEKVAAAGKLKHFDMKEVIKAEKEKKLKGKRKRGKKAHEGEGIQEGFAVDVKDPRFAALYEEHEFAIDPTNPRFKETAAMKELMKEKRSRSRKDGDENGEEDSKRKKVKSAAKEGDDVKRLVQSLKRKSAK